MSHHMSRLIGAFGRAPPTETEMARSVDSLQITEKTERPVGGRRRFRKGRSGNPGVSFGVTRGSQACGSIGCRVKPGNDEGKRAPLPSPVVRADEGPNLG